MPEHTCIQSIIPNLTVKDATRAIDFYKRAFGAEEKMRMAGPGGQGIMHAELQIGHSVFFLNDEFPGMGEKSPETLGGTAGSLYIAVDDVDAVIKAALEAGATQEMAVEDMFWGDRMGSVIDPFGHHWSIATHTEDVPPEELSKRAEEFFAKMSAGQPCGAEASI